MASAASHGAPGEPETLTRLVYTELKNKGTKRSIKNWNKVRKTVPWGRVTESGLSEVLVRWSPPVLDLGVKLGGCVPFKKIQHVG